MSSGVRINVFRSHDEIERKAGKVSEGLVCLALEEACRHLHVVLYVPVQVYMHVLCTCTCTYTVWAQGFCLTKQVYVYLSKRL